MTFQPGVSGNPKGRPKKADAIADVISERLQAPHVAEGRPHIVLIVEKAIAQAEAGDHNARAWLYKPKEGLELTGSENGEPVRTEVIVRHVHGERNDTSE